MQQEFCENLISVLHTMPIEINLLNSDLDLHYKNYDLVIAFNKQGYNSFKKLNLDIPLLYVMPSKDFMIQCFLILLYMFIC